MVPPKPRKIQERTIFTKKGSKSLGLNLFVTKKEISNFKFGSSRIQSKQS